MVISIQELRKDNGFQQAEPRTQSIKPGRFPWQKASGQSVPMASSTSPVEEAGVSRFARYLYGNGQ